MRDRAETGLALPADLAVLIVEDQPHVAMVAQDMVEMLGARVAGIATSVMEGLAACRAGGFSLALLDLDLGGRASVPVAEALTAAGKPFLLTTGFDRPPAGFEDVPLLAKPYTVRALRGALAALIGAPVPA